MDMKKLEQEAGSKKYGNDARIVMQLKGGEWAAYGPDRSLLGIVRTFPEIEPLLSTYVDPRPPEKIRQNPNSLLKSLKLI